MSVELSALLHTTYRNESDWSHASRRDASGSGIAAVKRWRLSMGANVARQKRDKKTPVDAPFDSSDRCFLELLVCGCGREDVEIVRKVCGQGGPRVHVVGKSVEIVQCIATRLPLALFLGIRRRDRGLLRMISVVRSLRKDLPVIVVAEEDSLELERRVRQQGVFYYFVHPLQSPEVEAVLKNLLHRARGGDLFREQP
jgi:CheY-like chemotaxis protein